MGRPLERGFLETCLSSASSLAAWAGAVAAAAEPLFERAGAHGGSLGIVTLSATPSPPLVIYGGVGPLELAAGDTPSRILSEMIAEQPAVEAAFGEFEVSWLSQRLGWPSLRSSRAWRRFPWGRRYHDQIGASVAHQQTTCILSGTVRDRGDWKPRGAADLRWMRRQLARTLPARLGPLLPDGADAVIAPDGRVLHAAAPLGRSGREILGHAVRLLESARVGSKSHEPEGERLWDELLAGRWSVVEHVDTDGKRVLLLSRSHEGALRPDERALLEGVAEGASVKQLACERGLAISTVSESLGRALAKLGFRSRADYVRYARRHPKH